MAPKPCKEIPQRSCIACRKSGDKNTLIRFVASPDGIITPDFDYKLPGRGAYTCISSKCLADAVGRKQFARAFKREILLQTPADLNSMMVNCMLARISGFVSLANKAGKIVAGGSMVQDAIRSSSKPGLILLATDTSDAVAEKIMALAEYNSLKLIKILNKDEYGALLGKAPKSAIAIRSAGFAGSIFKEFERYSNFQGEVQNK